MNYHMAKKHAPSRSKKSTICSSCEQEFPSYYSLQHHRRKEHGAKQRKPKDTVADLSKIVEEEGEDDKKLKEKLNACQHFLVDTKMENGRHKVFNFQITKLDTKQFNEILKEVSTLYVFGFNSGRYDLNSIKSLLIPYLIRDIEKETSTIKKANKFISSKFRDVQFLDIMKFLGGAPSLDAFLKAYKASETRGFFPNEWFDNPHKLDFPKLSPYEAFFSKVRTNNPLDKDFIDFEKLRKSGLDKKQALSTKWRFELITNVTIFAALLKNIPMGFPNSVLSGPLPKNHSVNCLLSNKAKEPYKDHLCLFRELAMYMNGHSNLDSHTSRYFTEFKTKSGYDPKNFCGASVVDLPDVDESVQRNIFIFDFDIQEGDYVGELARRILEDLIKQLNY